MADQYMPDNERDAILDKLLQLPENKQCFDCKSKNPKWASSSIGIFICYECTSAHRNYGVQISFVRSLKMDRWKVKDVKQMEFGGNKLAQIYYEKNGMFKNGKPDHFAPQLAKYKQELNRKALQDIGSYQPTAQLKEEQQKKENDISDIFGQKMQVVQQVQPQIQEIVPKHQKSLIQQQSSNTMKIFVSNQTQDNGKSINAKKLDINFDGDDFFNSFEPETKKKTEVIPPKNQYVSKLQEVNDPFEIKSNPKQETYSFSNNKSGMNTENDEEVRERLRALGNKKGISSEDIFGKSGDKTQDIKDRYTQLTGAKAISSDMFFGRADDAKEEGNAYVGRSSNTSNGYDEYREQAAQLASKVSENAKYLKEKALDWFSQFNQAS